MDILATLFLTISYLFLVVAACVAIFCHPVILDKKDKKKPKDKKK